MQGLKLPPMGPASRRRPIREGEGQPEPNAVEPSPLEVAEQRRGERDDVVRESMAVQAAEGGRNEGYLTGVGERELSSIGDSCLKLYRLLAGQYNYEHPFSGEVKNEAGEQEVGRVKAKAGKTFIIRRFSVLAPKGAKLRFYFNNVATANFIEVVTAAQEASGEFAGYLRLRENEHLVATVIGCEAAGTVVIHLEGDLVNEENLPW
jgi:hypothetical protein